MPRIQLSDRRLEGAMPQTRVFRPEYAETIGQGVGTLGRQLTRDFNSAIATLNQIKERDAEIAATEWETAMMRGLNGYVTTGPDGSEQRVPGFGQKTWADYPQDGSQSPITDLDQIERQFHSSAIYKGMDAITRTKFERRIQLRRQQYQLKANELYDRNRLARDRFYDQKADALDDEKLALAMYGDDSSFEAMNREVATNKINRRYRRIDRTNPQVQAAYERDLIAETRSAALGRVVSLGQQAAVGETKIVGDRIVSQSEELDRAEKYLSSLVQRGLVTQSEASATGYKLVQARSQLDNRIQGEIRNTAENAAVRIYEPDGLQNAETQALGFATIAAAFPKGSANQTAALKASKILDDACDKRVRYDIMNDLANGKNLFMTDGKTPIFQTGSRQAKLFPEVYKTFSEKRQREFNKGFRAAREQNLLVIRGKMMEFAAKGNPQGFYGYLAEQVVGKKLTAGDFTRLRNEFNEGWMKGFKGSPDQLARQTSMAKNMLGILKDRLNVDFSEAVKKDDYGDPVLKNGTLYFDDKKELPSAEVKRQFKKTVRRGDIFFSFGSDIGTRKEKISGEQLKGILNQAMNLWSCDGMKISYDPVTGEDLPEGKVHTVNAERDFSALLNRIADEKSVLSAAETLKSQAAYAANVRMQAQVDADRRWKKMMGSTPVTDKTLEDKNE